MPVYFAEGCPVSLKVFEKAKTGRQRLLVILHKRGRLRQTKMRRKETWRKCCMSKLDQSRRYRRDRAEPMSAKTHKR